jgi:hypothetical protein
MSVIQCAKGRRIKELLGILTAHCMACIEAGWMEIDVVTFETVVIIQI